MDERELERLVDGSIEEVLFSSIVLLHRSGGYVATQSYRPAVDVPQPNNLLRLEKADHSGDAPLVLKGYWYTDVTPSELQNENSVRSYFREHTWIGSLQFLGADHQITWGIFGAEYRFASASRYDARLGQVRHTHRVNLAKQQRNKFGTAVFQTSPNLSFDRVYTSTGQLDIDVEKVFEKHDIIG